MDEWRATIQSLHGFTEAGGSRRAGPPRPPQETATACIASGTEGIVPTVQSQPWQPTRAQQNQDPTTSRWPVLTLDHVQANVEPRRMGGEETRVLSSSNATMTFAGPTGATASTSTILRSVLAGAYLSRLAALPLHESCGKSVGRPFACSSQRYL